MWTARSQPAANLTGPHTMARTARLYRTYQLRTPSKIVRLWLPNGTITSATNAPIAMTARAVAMSHSRRTRGGFSGYTSVEFNGPGAKPHLASSPQATCNRPCAQYCLFVLAEEASV